MTINQLRCSFVTFACSFFCAVTQSWSQFAPATHYAVQVSPVSVASADLNQDQATDLIVANGASNSVSVLMNDLSGGFPTRMDTALGTSPFAVAAADLDGDGDNDIVVTLIETASCQVLWNDGSAHFALGPTLAVGGTPRSVAIGDLDGDGRNDVIATSRDNNNIAILHNDGNGVFASAQFVAAGSRPRDLVIAHLNADAAPDVAAINQGSDDITILLNNGSGGLTYSSAVSLPTGHSPESLAAGDLDRDGDIDLAAATTGSLSGLIAIYVNNGSASFSAGPTLPAGSDPASVKLADISLDGRLDIVIANRAVSAIRTYQNVGGLTYGTATEEATGQDPYYITVGDVDLNGTPDVATPNFTDNTVSVLHNAAQPHPGDMDLDGDVDAADIAAFTAILLGNDGDIVRRRLADLNSDGRPDGQDVAMFIGSQ